MKAILIRKALGTGLARSIGSLYAIQCASYLVPLMTLPWLARVLGPSGLGLLAFMQGFGSCITLVVEYGFRFSGTQQASVHRHSPDRLSELIAGVQGGKAILAIVFSACAFAIQPFIPLLRGHGNLFAAGIFAAVGQAFAMTWYFLGVERMPRLAAVESALRLLGALGVVMLVKTRADDWKVLVIQGSALWIAAIVGLALAHRDVRFQWPSVRVIRDALSNGRAALFFRIAETSYTSCNAMLLGFFCSPEVVGLYAGADKIARSMLIALLDPVQRSVYPGVSRMLAVSRNRAAGMVRVSAIATVSVATIVSAILFVIAPQVSRLLLGREFDAAIPTLRILLFVPVAVAWKWSIALNWMVPVGEVKAFNTVIAGSAVLHLAATTLLAPHFHQTGMAAGVALTEVVIPACVYVVLRRRHLDPFQLARETAPSEPKYGAETEVHCH
jgi:PST family polysaccharide transporter